MLFSRQALLSRILAATLLLGMVAVLPGVPAAGQALNRRVEISAR
jgi:hypothetical protein